MSSLINLREVAPPTVTAGIFDMDDLMIDSHPLHMDVFATVLGMYGVDIHDPSNPWTPRDEVGMFGLKISDAFKLFISRYKLENADPETMRHQFDAQMLPVFEHADIKPMPGLMDLIHSLVGGNVQLALASSARLAKIEIVLGKLGLDDGTFEAVVSGQDHIKHGKPAPDIFLQAARKLGKLPAACMAFEDAQNGVEAINAAGMFSVGVHNQFSLQRLGISQNLSGASLQVNSLSELTYLK
jgi:HAD superfamily hydrolase (TIGR01509 family)